MGGASSKRGGALESSGIEHIIGSGGEELLATIIRRNFNPDEMTFITDVDSVIQVGVGMYKFGKKVKPHYHKVLKEEIPISKFVEIFHVDRGVMKLILIDKTRKKHEVILYEGDTAICFSGHALEIQEDNTRIIEVKPGPYLPAYYQKRYLED